MDLLYHFGLFRLKSLAFPREAALDDLANAVGNAHLEWAFSEDAVLLLRANPRGQQLLASLDKKHGKAKALSVLAHKLGRAVYFILQRNQPFDSERFYAMS